MKQNDGKNATSKIENVLGKTHQVEEDFHIICEAIDHIKKDRDFWIEAANKRSEGYRTFRDKYIASQNYLDEILSILWDELGDIPFDDHANSDMTLATPWLCFSVGTEREEIWHWFDERHSKGVAWLLGASR